MLCLLAIKIKQINDSVRSLYWKMQDNSKCVHKRVTKKWKEAIFISLFYI